MDKYDKAIEYLIANPHKIHDAWNNPPMVPEAGCLFVPVDKLPFNESDCGCLVQIRNQCLGYQAITPELTREIIADTRIPDREWKIDPNNLPVFAEWHRRLDKELQR